MALFVASINSGSNGNCYYVGNDTEAVLVDAGISCRETEKRMKAIGLRMDRVKAIFVSHEHGDQIKGIEGIVAKHNIPVYITQRTLAESKLKIPPQLARDFEPLQPVGVAGLDVLPFPKWHDAIDPHSFVVSGDGVRIGVFTDIGAPCEHVMHHFSLCNAVFLEANYDDEMLVNGRYSPHLKNRIQGQFGHLSNDQALELFRRQKSANLSHLFLSHLSKDNNKPEVASNLFATHAGATKIAIASRYGPSAVFKIEGSDTTKPSRPATVLPRPVQMRLFASEQ